jgi:mono/diheme cytochrome c family protein
MTRLSFAVLTCLLASGLWGADSEAVDGLRPGLAATYREGNHTVRLAVPSPNFHLEAEESVHPSLGPAFEAEWQGLISILQAGTYRFRGGRFRGGLGVAVGGSAVGDAGMRLSPGRHAIRLGYRREPGEAVVRLEWKAEHFDWEPVPGTRLLHDPATAARAQDELIERGRGLARRLGCVNCHAANSPSLRARLGPRLTGLRSRTKREWVYHWLTDPSAFRADATMPRMLDDAGRRDVAAYLTSLSGGEASAEIEKVPRHDRRRGASIFSTLGCGACHRRNALALEGMGSKTTLGALTEYLMQPAKFDPGGGMPSMLLTREEAGPLAASLLESTNPAFEEGFDGGDAVRGKKLVRTAGCLACHELQDPQPLANEHRAAALERLTPERGCLAEPPPAETPHYRLTPDDRRALQAFVRAYSARPDVSPAPVYEFYNSLDDLRCLSCHAMGPVGPVPEKAPPLTGVGGMVQGDWLAEVMTQRRRIHKRLELRMPHYEPRQVEPLMAGFAKAAGLKPGAGDGAPAATETAEAHGVGILGVNGDKGGLGCIGCHGLRERRSLGENGPDLTHAAQRLRYDWFHRWMRDPARIVSGTSMPNYFGPMEPAEAREKIDALWAALSMGERMPLPEGFAEVRTEPGSEAQPIPADRPIVIRWDMPEATPSAFAVGLPGGVSYCFDAGESRLRYAWLGGYVDMTGTLYEKRDPKTRLTRTADLVGEIFYRSEGFPLRVGDANRIPQRRFRGYGLVEGSPEFHYQVDGIDVYETVRATEGKDGLIREFRIGRVEQAMWFLAKEAAGVAVSTSLGAFAGGKVLIPQGVNVTFEVTVRSGSAEGR